MLQCLLNLPPRIWSTYPGQGRNNSSGFEGYSDNVTRDTKCTNQKKRPTHLKIQYFTRDDFIYLSRKIINKYVRARFWPVLKNGLGIISSLNEHGIFWKPLFWGNSDLRWAQVTGRQSPGLFSGGHLLSSGHPEPRAGQDAAHQPGRRPASAPVLPSRPPWLRTWLHLPDKEGALTASHPLPGTVPGSYHPGYIQNRSIKKTSSSLFQNVEIIFWATLVE